MHLRSVVSARHRSQKGAEGSRGHRTEPLRRSQKAAARRQDEGCTGQPGHRLGPGTADHGQGRKSYAALPGKLVRAQRQSRAERPGNQEPTSRLRQWGVGLPERDVRIQLERDLDVQAGDARSRRTRPAGTAAGNLEVRRRAALRGGARQPDHHRAVHRLHRQPRRDRPDDRLADLRWLHAHLRSEPRRRASVRGAADQARTDLPVPGVGDARQDSAQTGPDRRARGLPRGVPVPARLLPRAGG